MAATASMRGLAVACLLWAGLTPSSRADALATFDDGARRIVLLTQRCAPAAGGQQAQARSEADRLDGCWTVNARGNPVVRWRDGRTQELPESGVRLTPAYTALLDGFSATRPSDAGFPRARWCENARLPHERLVCRDPELAAADLALAPLWQSYRRTVRPAEQARVRSDYFRRLKACGARKACIAKEQSAQERFYRRGLRSE